MTQRSPDAARARRMAYVALSLPLALAAGQGIARIIGEPGEAVWAASGSGIAWVIQSLSFWWLAGLLSAGRKAVLAWGIGIAGRGGGFAVLWIAAGSWGPGGRVMAVAYAISLLALLLLEAVWLSQVRLGVRH